MIAEGNHNDIPINLAFGCNESVLERVMEYDHPMLLSRLEEELKITHQKAEELFNDTKQFLYQCYLSKMPVSPTAIIDEGWHNFILFTRDYADFCESHFGYFIHHTPLEKGAKAEGCKGNYCKGCTHGKCE